MNSNNPVLGRGFGQGQRYATFNTPTPSPNDLQDMYNARQYRTCAQQVARALNVKTPAAAGLAYDRGQLLSLRGDCLLNLGDRSGAIKPASTAARTPHPGSLMCLQSLKRHSTICA